MPWSPTRGAGYGTGTSSQTPARMPRSVLAPCAAAVAAARRWASVDRGRKADLCNMNRHQEPMLYRPLCVNHNTESNHRKKGHAQPVKCERSGKPGGGEMGVGVGQMFLNGQTMRPGGQSQSKAGCP